MSESSQHVLLKEVAKEILKMKGYTEILEEFPVISAGQVLPIQSCLKPDHPIKAKKSVYADLLDSKKVTALS